MLITFDNIHVSCLQPGIKKFPFYNQIELWYQQFILKDTIKQEW